MIKKALTLSRTDLRLLPRDIRALRQDILELRAGDETRARQEIASSPAQERSNIILERYMNDPNPSEHPSLED